MTKVFELKGLDCANCAAKIEHALQNTSGVAKASLSFATGTLSISTCAEFGGDIDDEVNRIVHKYEPDVVVAQKDAAKKQDEHGHSHDKRKGKLEVLRLVCGAALFGAGVILNNLLFKNSLVGLGIFIAAYIVLGLDVLLKAAKNLAKGQLFDENFLMTIATIGAFAIGDFAEGAGVMLFYQVGELFQNMAVRQSKKSISQLMDIRPDYANVQRNGITEKLGPQYVAVGEIIVVKPGEKVPLDGRVTEGTSMLNTAALTGEAVPRSAKPKDEVLSGSINLNGVLFIEVTKTFKDSTVSKIIDLVENASSKKAPTENFITKFSRYYTPAVVLLAALLALVPPLFFGGIWADWFERGLIFLVISCPCALVISIPLGFFGGIGAASRSGILVKGGNYLEALNSLDIVVFDKTGTLTKGVFELKQIEAANGFTQDKVLEYAAFAECFSGHPIALSIKTAYGKTLDENLVQNHKDMPGHGVSAQIKGQLVLAGNKKLMQTQGIVFTALKEVGTQVYVAVNGKFAGGILISDEIKKDSHSTIAALKARGVRKTIMLTGDANAPGQAIANALELDEVYTQLLPDEKVAKLEEIYGQKLANGKLAFVGDGINDAPVLARADIGIAMGGLGSDAAIEAADIVLMTDEPLKLALAIDIAKKTRRIVWQNIVFALSVKAVFLLMGAFGYATMWEAVFADVGVAVLAILNAMRVLKVPR